MRFFLGLLVHDSFRQEKSWSLNETSPSYLFYNKRCPARKQKHSVRTINLKKNPPQCGSYHCHVTLSWRTESDNNLVMCFSGSASSSQIGVDCIYTSQFSLVV